jgi:hypothetical protein
MESNKAKIDAIFNDCQVEQKSAIQALQKLQTFSDKDRVLRNVTAKTMDLLKEQFNV